MAVKEVEAGSGFRAIQRVGVKPCSVPEQRAKRESDLPVLISFRSRPERPGISQHVPAERDKVGHLATEFRLGLWFSIGRRHDARFGSGGSVALITGSCRVRVGDKSMMALSLPGRWSILLTLQHLSGKETAAAPGGSRGRRFTGITIRWIKGLGPRR